MFVRPLGDPRPAGVSTRRQPAMVRMSQSTLAALRELQTRSSGLSLDAIVYMLAMAALSK